jgi:hypothetical protein
MPVVVWQNALIYTFINTASRNCLMHRKPNPFEIALAIVGISVVGIGVYMLKLLYTLGTSASDLIIAVLLWLMLIFLVILAAIAESQREDLSIIMRDVDAQLIVVRELQRDVVTELRVFKDQLTDKKLVKK